MYSAMYADSTLTTGALETASIMGFFASYSVFVIIIGVISIIASWLLFKKSGKPGWASIVPIYSNVVLFQIVGLNPWLLLLYLVPFVNYVAIIVLNIMVAFRLAKSFGYFHLYFN